MKQFISPELEMIRLDVVDVITASGDVPAPTTVAPTTTVPSTTAPTPTVSDAGLDNEVSADKWVF